MKKILIISDSGSKVGLGHFTRSKILSDEINYYFKRKFKIKNIFFLHDKKRNNFFENKFIRNMGQLKKEVKKNQPNIIFLNNSQLFVRKFGFQILKFLRSNLKNIIIISVDSYFKHLKFLNHLWVPNIAVMPKFKNHKKVHYGWDKLLIRIKNKKIERKQRKIIISLGGTDYFNLIKNIPNDLSQSLKIPYKIDLLVGPFAKKPKKNNNLKINFLQNKKNINYLSKYSLGIVLFGVSFFELLIYKIPCIILIPPRKEDSYLIKKLKNYNFLIASNLNESIKKLNMIANNKKYKKKFISFSRKIKLSNRKIFYEKLFNLNNM